MTITSTTNRVSIGGNGETTTFSFPHRFLQPSDLVVILRTNATKVDVVQTLGTHYNVTGEGDATGGSVIFDIIEDGEPAAGETVIIYNDPGITQGTDFRAGDPLPAETLETTVDLLTLQQQRTRSMVDRTPRLSDGDTDGSGAYDANSNKIESLGTPTAASDATTKTYVDALVNNTALGPAPTGLIATGGDTSRTLADRWKDVANVKDFGAVGDGSTDDTLKVQAAINEASEGRKTVYFPEGVYICSALTSKDVELNLVGASSMASTIKLKSNANTVFTDATCDTVDEDATVTMDSTSALKVGMVVTGAGMPDGAWVESIHANGTEFELSAAADANGTNVTLTFTDEAILFSNNNTEATISLRHLTIDGNKAGQHADIWKHTFDFKTVDNLVVDSCRFENGIRNVLNVGHIEKTCSIQNCIFTDGKKHSGTANELTSYINISSTADDNTDDQYCIIANNVLVGLDPITVSFARNGTTTATGTTTELLAGMWVSGPGIPDNTEIDSIAGGGGSIVLSNAATTTETNDLTFGGAGVGGIFLKHGGSGGDSLADSKLGVKAIIRDNFIKNCGMDLEGNRLAGISLYRTVPFTVISGNRIFGGDEKGIDCQGSYALNISHNHVANTRSNGIEVASRDGELTCSRAIISHNMVEGVASGVGIQAAGHSSVADTFDVSVIGNIVDDCVRCLQIDDYYGDIVVTENQFSNSSATDTTSIDEQAVAILSKRPPATALRCASVLFSSNALTNHGRAVYIYNFARNVVVSGNSFVGFSATDARPTLHIVGNATGSAATGSCTVDGNAFQDVEKAITLKNLKSAMVSNNTIDDTNGQDRTLGFDDFDAASIIAVTGNIITGAVNEVIKFENCRGTNFVNDNLSIAGASIKYLESSTPIIGNGFYPQKFQVENTAIATLANSSTPSVAGGRYFKTPSGRTVTNFDSAEVGQEIVILSEHAFTITDGTNIILHGSANFVMAASDSLTLVLLSETSTATITGITKGATTTITASNSFSTNDTVAISGVVDTGGDTPELADALNGKRFTVASASGSSFVIDLDSSDTTATWSSAGTAEILKWHELSRMVNA